MNWLTTEPPKDENQFLADVDLPWPVVAVWNTFDEKFVYANLKSRMVNGICNSYYETERVNAPGIKRWMPLPEFK